MFCVVCVGLDHRPPIYPYCVDGYLPVVDVHVQYGYVKCYVFTYQWLRVMIFSNVYDCFDLLLVGRDGCYELSHAFQQW